VDQLGISLDQPASYWQIWEWISVSVPNIIVIVTMLLLFVVALVAPFPKGKDVS
jgi:hypothetical protein